MNAADLNNKQQEVKNVIEKQISNSTYIICSTLNQMVNFIPYHIFHFKEIYNITISAEDKSKYFDNELWDENFKNIVGSETTIIDKFSIPQNQMSCIQYIKNELACKLEKDKSYTWNITGGQRPLLLAITAYINEDEKRAKDFICYLEGNYNNLIIMQNGRQIYEKGVDIDDKSFSIETALKLAGFRSNNKKDKKSNYLVESGYLDLVIKYINDCKDKAEIREFLIDMNKNTSNNNPDNNEFLKAEIDAMKNKNITAPFGYILERMAYALIINTAEKYLADYAINYNINFEEERQISGHPIDEFDIVLLTRQGKLIIFECKSGAMPGDVAKSHKYSTYAVAGVYGKPILITPLLKAEIEQIYEDAKSIRLDKPQYEYIKATINAARRAALETWGIDEIGTRLEKLLDIK